MKSIKYRALIITLIGAVAVTFLCGSGILKRPDLWVQDELYQKPQSVPGDIIIIGIDDKAIQDLGPYNTWDRTVMASALEALGNEEKYGMILRAKGIVAGADGQWIHFDYVPGESEVRTGAADVTGKLCIIGSNVKKDKVKELFGV